MKIGNLTLNGVAALAPMAGATDRPFRELCCSFGAAYCVTEMVSTRALQYNYKKTQELITLGEKEHPVAIQMFGETRSSLHLPQSAPQRPGRMLLISIWVALCRKLRAITAAAP